MFDLLLSLTAGAVGGLFAFHLVVRSATGATRASENAEPIGDDEAQRIMELAREYAAERGRPEVAELVARKLLLAHRFARTSRFKAQP